MPEAASEATPLPLDGSPEGNARPSGWSKTWIVLGLLVVCHAVVGAYFNPIGVDRNDVGACRAYLSMGVVFSQPILLAIWASFAIQRFDHRFLWSLLLCTAVSFAEELSILFHGYHLAPGQLMVEDISLFLTATIILSVFRHFSRWQIKQPDMEEAPSAYGAYHFGIEHLLILTTITALGCGLFRTLCLINPDHKIAPSIAQYIGFTCVYLALLFPVIAIPWYILAYQRRLLSLLPLTLIIWGMLDVAACLLIMKLDSRPSSISLYDCLLIQLGSSLSTFATTLVLRFCGFRMIREAKIQKKG